MKLSNVLFALVSGSVVFVACAAEQASTTAKPAADSGLADSFHDTLAELGVELGVPDADAEPPSPTTVTKACTGSGADYFAIGDFPGKSKEWIAMNAKALVCITGAVSWPCYVASAVYVQDGGMRVRCAETATAAPMVTVTFMVTP